MKTIIMATPMSSLNRDREKLFRKGTKFEYRNHADKHTFKYLYEIKSPNGMYSDVVCLLNGSKEPTTISTFRFSGVIQSSFTKLNNL